MDWLAVLVVLLIVGAYGALIARARVIFRRSRVHPLTLIVAVSGPPAEVRHRLLRELVGPLHSVGYGLISQRSDGLTFERRYRPAWVVLIVTLTFWLIWPLLVLLVTRRAVLEVSLEGVAATTSVAVGGLATPAADEIVRRALPG